MQPSFDATSGTSFVFTSTATTQNYTLSLHDALPIWRASSRPRRPRRRGRVPSSRPASRPPPSPRGRPPWRPRSEEHTSELQSLAYLVCRLLLEKKNNPFHQRHLPRPRLYPRDTDTPF